METHQIRLRYSGFIVFTTQVLSLITGLVFTLLLTRNMSTDQFNIWTNIFDYTGYFLLFNPVLPFWATRFVARGKEGAVKTSVSAQLSIALASTIIYFPSYIFDFKSHWNQKLLADLSYRRLLHFDFLFNHHL